MQNGTTFFFGPIFIHPEETVHEPTKMFYKREVFLSHLEETLPMTCVIGAVLIPDKDSISIMCPFLPAPFFFCGYCFVFVIDPVFVLSGKCMVSSFKDYLSCRPTEVAEEDNLLCESRYIESEKQVKKFKGLKRFSYSSKVAEDEVYYFRRVHLYKAVVIPSTTGTRLN